MPQAKKKKRVEQTPESTVARFARERERKNRQTVYFICGLGITVILLIAGLLCYSNYVAPFNTVVMTVDGTQIRMDYFLKRTKLAGNDPTTMLQQLADEQIVKLKAPEFGIEVTPSDINGALLYTASVSSTENVSENITRYLTENEFKKWYSEQLKTTGLSDAEYKDMARTNLLATRLQQYLAQQVPTMAEQIHLNVILVANSSDAAKAKARIAAGESFAAVARDVSLDTKSKENGGDVGWVPRGLTGYDDVTFALAIGQVSEPVAVDSTNPSNSQYVLFMVSEKDANRKIDDDSMQVLKSNALNNWLTQEMSSHNITINYDFNNTENQAWINWQLSKTSKTK